VRYFLHYSSGNSKSILVPRIRERDSLMGRT
jgi:hypothetical protein